MNEGNMNLGQRVGFLHFPKTAGTTLGNAIISRANDRIAVTSWKEADAADLTSPQVVHGHLLYDQLVECMGPEGFLMTNFRHPIERIFSLYRFRQRRPDDPHHEAAMSMTLAEFVEAGYGTHTYLPQLTHEVVKDDNGVATGVRPSPGTPADRLALAEKRIDSFDHVGISEYFDYSMLLLAHDLGVEPFWSAATMNTAPSPTSRKDLDEDTIEVIKRCVAGEIRLYNYALKRFKRDISKLVGAPEPIEQSAKGKGA